MNRRHIAVAAGALALVLPRVAAAHISLLEPRARSAGIDEGYSAEGPCGGYAKTFSPTVFAPGGVVEIRASVNPHTNQYRVALSPPGDEGFEDNVLGIYDAYADEAGEVAFKVRLPEKECRDCTLQVVMWDAGWYACADVDVTGDPSSGSEGSGSGGPRGGGDGGGGGCATAAGNAEGAVFGGTTALALFFGALRMRSRRKGGRAAVSRVSASRR